MDRQRLWEIARIGVPAGIQASLFSIANIAIQGAINVYGSVVMAGCSAAMSVENFLYLSMNAFQQACQTLPVRIWGRESMNASERSCASVFPVRCSWVLFRAVRP